MKVLVMFTDFSIKAYDVRRMYKNNPWYLSLESMPGLFARGYLANDTLFVWNSVFDISTKDCWEHGEPVKNGRTAMENLALCRQMLKDNYARRLECEAEEREMSKPVLFDEYKKMNNIDCGEYEMTAAMARDIERGLECNTHDIVKSSDGFSYYKVCLDDDSDFRQHVPEAFYEYCVHCKKYL